MHLTDLARRLTRVGPALALAAGTLAAPAAGLQSGPAFRLVEAGHGHGQRLLLPHRLYALDASGNPTAQVVDVRSHDDLLAHLRPNNPLLPPRPWPKAAILPNGFPGNHFVYATFSEPLEPSSILDTSPAGQAASGLLGTISVLALDPVTGAATPVRGRAFVEARTPAKVATGTPPQHAITPWARSIGGTNAATAVDDDGDGVPDGAGFPGSDPNTGFDDDWKLVGANAFVFVPDADDDLTTFETFPADREIVLRITTGVRSSSGAALAEPACAAATVGRDLLAPELGFGPPPGAQPLLEPAPGDLDVDPRTTIRASFTEPLQPLSVGPLFGGPRSAPAYGLLLEFGPPSYRTQVPFSVRAPSVYDLSVWELVPDFAFPGKGSAASCGSFHRVDLRLDVGAVADLRDNYNVLTVSSFFETGAGPGLVNAPVAPDAIYAATFGATPGVGVIDLNGFGGSTGDPTYDFTGGTFPEGNSNFPNDPNVRFLGPSLRPPLTPGTCTVDGGSSGAFRCALGSNLSASLLAPPLVASAVDLMLGQSLDTTFHGGAPPLGCQAGAPDPCAETALKLAALDPGGPNTLAPSASPPGLLATHVAGANPISWSPHPNPPPLDFPPPCVSPWIGARQPSSVENGLPPPGGPGLTNLLGPGDPFGTPGSGVPPSGLATREQNVWFQGPSPSASAPACEPFAVRQQIGHFLYVLDRVRAELVVVNSNRMTVLDRVPLPDPTEMALAPDLSCLAITNQAAGSLSFVDVDPSSSSFHQVVHEIQVGLSPRGVAWESENEDLLVCNEGDGTVSIVSAFSLQVRKVLSAHLTQPFAVATTPRQGGFGHARDVYFGYVLNRDGSLAVFESGPDGLNGWGYDDVIGLAAYTFGQPKALQADPTDLRGAVWIAHQGPIDPATGQVANPVEGALTKLRLDATLTGPQPLAAGGPQFRSMQALVEVSVDETELSGAPIDIAFDDLRNLGALPGHANPFSAGTPAPLNGKGQVRDVQGAIENANEPLWLFAAAPTGNVIDVIDLAAGTRLDTNPWQAGVQSIAMPGAAVLMDWFRQ